MRGVLGSKWIGQARSQGNLGQPRARKAGSPHASNRHHSGRRSGHAHAVVVAEDAAPARRPVDAAPSAGKLRGGVRPHRRGARARTWKRSPGKPRRTPASCSRNAWAPPTPRCRPSSISATGEVAVLYADNPLIRPQTLHRLLDARQARRGGLPCWRSGRPIRPLRPGRHRSDGLVERIVEWADATRGGTRRSSCATPACCAPPRRTWRRWLHAVRNDNAKGEYLPDRRRRAGPRRRAPRRGGGGARPTNWPGSIPAANSRAAEAVVQGWLRDAAMEAGVTMIDPVLGVPVRRHQACAGRDDRAERGVRPWRDGRRQRR